MCLVASEPAPAVELIDFPRFKSSQEAFRRGSSAPLRESYGKIRTQRMHTGPLNERQNWSILTIFLPE